MKNLEPKPEKSEHFCQLNDVVYKITVFNNEFVNTGFFKMNKIKGEIYHKKYSELTEEEKRVVICPL